jgi:hypothetical protein
MGKNETLPIKSGLHQGCLISSFLFNVVFDFLARLISQEK